ncbi:fatty acyl-CoA reductase wat-like isoform X2 [Vespula maculifrons]|uniref:Fatty acyl-CoA reductase wat-like isoform X2 n=1 Tax=Vespula maculifrons TaxID=7453 RepID=A0ABD2BPC1_VESMC
MVLTAVFTKTLTPILMHIFQLFSTLRKKKSKFQYDIVIVKRNCTLVNLDFSMTDRTIFIYNVSIVFHVGMIVRFNEKIKSTTTINIRSLQ